MAMPPSKKTVIAVQTAAHVFVTLKLKLIEISVVPI
jgi:hypothetical protein